MGLSFEQYTATGGENQYAIPFPYLEESDITVALDGVDEPFTFSTSTLVDITSGNPTSGVIVEVRRTTNRATREVDYQNGTNLGEATLDLDSNQLFFITQEAFDEVANSIKLNALGVYDALDIKVDGIGNLPDFTTTYDDFAMNLEMVKSYFAANVVSAGALVVHAFWKGILDEGNLGDSMTALGLSSAVQSVLDDTSLGAMRTTMSVPAITDVMLNTLLTTRGDIVIRGASAPARLAVGTVGQVLGTDGTDPVWESASSPALPKGSISGLNTSNDTDADHDINVTAGTCRSTDDTTNLTLASEMTKRIDAQWAAGDNNGGLASSLTVGNDTWYHVFIVDKTGGGIDIGLDTSIIATNLLSDTGGTKFRRIWSVQTGTSANIDKYTQVGDHGVIEKPPIDVDVSDQGTTVVNRTMSAPLGVKCLIRMNVQIDISGQTLLYIRDMDAREEAPSGNQPHATMANDAVGGVAYAGAIDIMSNLLSQVSTRANGSSMALEISTLGWEDNRGKDE